MSNLRDTRDFYLPKHREGARSWSSHRSLPSRKTGAKKVNLVVLHTSEQKPDFHPPDHGAEWLAEYAASTTRQASWHVNTDADSIIWLLPDEDRAWHVKRYSQASVGVEMATKAELWDTLPAWWVDGCLRNTAMVVAWWCVKFGIPPELITRKQVDAGQAGITYHGWLDPSRRSDPGVHGEFPQKRFFDDFLPESMRWQRANPGVPPTALRCTPEKDPQPAVSAAPQTDGGGYTADRVLEYMWSSTGRKIPPEESRGSVERLQRWLGVPVSGELDDRTRQAMRKKFGW